PRTIERRQAEIEAIHRRFFPPVNSTPPASSSLGANGHARQAALPDDDALIRTGCNGSRMGGKFTALWNGDYTAYPSCSEADLALCNYLAFLCGPDPARVDRLFRLSGLMRPKWDRSHYAGGETYGHHTVERAVSDQRHTYRNQSGRTQARE